MNASPIRAFVGLAAAFMVITVSGEPVVVVVHPANPVGQLSQEDVKNIFLGKVKSFPSGALALPVDQPKGEVQSSFMSQVLNKNEGEMRAYWASQIFTGKGKPPQVAKSNEEVGTVIKDNKNAISYMKKSDASGVKVIFEQK